MRTSNGSRLTPQKGFSLLEAIVALALLAVGTFTLVSWMNTALLSQSRVEGAYERIDAIHDALEVLHTINPMKEPDGTRNLGSFSIHWESTPMENPRDGAGYPAGRSLYRIGLYHTRVDLYRKGKPWFQFELDQVGYQRVRRQRLPR